MPSDASPAHNPNATRQGTPEKLQLPSSRGGVRMLLGLPFSDNGALSTAALTTPPGRHHHGQLPLPELDESSDDFAETAPDRGVSEAASAARGNFPERLARRLLDESDTPKGFAGAPLADRARFSRAVQENPADARSTPAEPSAVKREQTRLVIPGVSTHRTDFPAFFEAAGTPTISVEGEPRYAIPQQAAPLNAPASLPHAREMTRSDVELLTRVEQLVTEGARPERMQNGERDLAQRFEHLQQTVRDLAASVSAQAARSRDESQLQARDQKRTPPERIGIITRSDASSTTPRAFWERSRLGRFYLKTGG
jgi:hypothetical protein